MDNKQTVRKSTRNAGKDGAAGFGGVVAGIVACLDEALASALRVDLLEAFVFISLETGFRNRSEEMESDYLPS